MFEIVHRYFPRKRLEGITGPTWVNVEAEVSSPSTTISPLSSFAAAAFRVTWVEGIAMSGNQHASAGVLFSDAIASGWMGRDLSLVSEGRSIHVPLAGLALVAPVDPQDATLLVGHMPTEFRYLLDVSRSGGLYFREHALRAGDAVRLRARVCPAERAGGYRDAARQSPSSDFVVQPDCGARLFDLSAGAF